MSLMIKVHTSSQKRYVSRWPCACTVRVKGPVVAWGGADLECEARLDLVGEDIGDGLVEVGENLHGELGLDTALGDEVVERVCEGTAQTAAGQPDAPDSGESAGAAYLLRR
jgi:hypothetical protein